MPTLPPGYIGPSQQPAATGQVGLHPIALRKVVMIDMKKEKPAHTTKSTAKREDCSEIPRAQILRIQSGPQIGGCERGASTILESAIELS